MAPQFHVATFIRFYNYVRITGVFYAAGQNVTLVAAVQSGSLAGSGKGNLPVPGQTVPCGFAITFLAEHFDPEELYLAFELQDGTRFQVLVADAAKRHLQNEAECNKAEARFFEQLKTPGFERVLEIGSRARSGITRRELFSGKQYTGIDVLEGPNVDVIGDAHVMSTHLQPESFDAVYSVSTFEHLAMPWKVALELNQVLRTGGIAYFMTHQALGMHDLPWDFWRYSDTAWDAIFNSYTGFRKLATFLGGPMNLVPTMYWDHWKGAEGAIGFSLSAVLIEKTGPTKLTWDVDIKKAIRGIYPN